MPKPVKASRGRVGRNAVNNPTRVGHAWQLHAAKTRLSEVYRLTRTEGPQLITRRGKDAVVMMPVEQFDHWLSQSRQPKSLVQFFRESPFVGLELDFEGD